MKYKLLVAAVLLVGGIMSYKLLGGGSNLDTIVNDMNQNVLELKNQEVSKVIKDETGTRVVILDKNGLRTTQPGAGIDVFTAEDSEFTFNSNNNVFKIVDEGTISSPDISIPAPGAGNYDTEINTTFVSHDLGYTPAVIAFLEDSSGYFTLPYTKTTGSGTAATWQTLHAVTTTTQVGFRINAMATGGTGLTLAAGNWTLKYYLLQETAN